LVSASLSEYLRWFPLRGRLIQDFLNHRDTKTQRKNAANGKLAAFLCVSVVRY
jgi:hypothetical protein